MAQVEALEHSAELDVARYRKIWFHAAVLTIMRRELYTIFYTPIAYVLLMIFLLLLSGMAFQLGGFFEREQADLDSVFRFVPWLLLVFTPALTMRAWSEELRSGTVEWLMTMGVSTPRLVAGKFLANWMTVSIGVVAMLPYWLIISWLGDPDHRQIFAGFIATFCLAGVYVAVGLAFSALTRNQVVAFVTALAALVFVTGADSPLVLDSIASLGWHEFRVLLSRFSILPAYGRAISGILSLYDLVVFLAYTGFFLSLNWLAIDKIRR